MFQILSLGSDPKFQFFSEEESGLGVEGREGTKENGDDWKKEPLK